MEIPKDISNGLNALKQAKKLGDDTGKFVGEIQSDMEKSVQNEQKKRVQERRQLLVLQLGFQQKRLLFEQEANIHSAQQKCLFVHCWCVPSMGQIT